MIFSYTDNLRMGMRLFVIIDCMNKRDNTNFWFLVSYIAGQQQHFRPFFDTRFTGHLLELRRKSDPFTMAGANPQGKKTSYLFETIELLWNFAHLLDRCIHLYELTIYHVKFITFYNSVLGKHPFHVNKM